MVYFYFFKSRKRLKGSAYLFNYLMVYRIVSFQLAGNPGITIKSDE